MTIRHKNGMACCLKIATRKTKIKFKKYRICKKEKLV